MNDVPKIALHSSRVRSMMRSRELDASRNHKSECVGCLHTTINKLHGTSGRSLSLFFVFQVFSEQILVFEVGRQTPDILFVQGAQSRYLENRLHEGEGRPRP